MIDLHCHILPEIDDGAVDIGVSVAMARMAVADGIGTIACTPHIQPGVYKNTGESIAAAVGLLEDALAEAGIPLQLVIGADAHLAPGMLGDLRSGHIPTLAGSRYFLFEPPHHVVPPRLHDFVFGLVTGGYVPILTHPERVSWIDSQYDLIKQLAVSGVLIQLTAGSIMGQFGRRAKYWSERLLSDGMVDLLATDAHDVTNRRPLLAAAREAVSRRFGDEMATRLVATNPLCVLQNVILSDQRAPVDEQRIGN